MATYSWSIDKLYTKDTSLISVNENNIKQNLPRILSTNIWGRECYIRDLKEELETIKITQQKKKKNRVQLNQGGYIGKAIKSEYGGVKLSNKSYEKYYKGMI